MSSLEHIEQRARNKAKGFTLVEVMVAMVIFSLLMMLVSNAMSFSFGFWSRNHSQLDNKISEFITFEKLSRAVKATQPYGVKAKSGKLELFFIGQENEVFLVSDLGLYKPGPSMISLALRTDESGVDNIMVAETSLQQLMLTEKSQVKDLQQNWKVLFENVRSARFDYFGYGNLSNLNHDYSDPNPFSSMTPNKGWFPKFDGSQTLILPEVIRITFEQMRQGQWVERSLSFKVQINDVRRYILINLERVSN